jgi:uncharacterized protein
MSLNPDAEYFAFLRDGKFMIQRSKSTGRHVFYPRLAEPGTGLADLEWVAPSGMGTVYSTTVMRQKPPEPNYNVALIDLDEGVRMMSRVEGVAAEDVKIGMRVRASVQGEGDKAIVIFKPA